MVGTLRLQVDARSVIQPQTTLFGLFCWDFEPLTPPDALDALLVHQPPRPTKKSRNPPIAIAAILVSKLNDVGSQSCLIISSGWCLALCRSVLPQSPAGSSLGYPKLRHDMAHTRAATCGA